MLLSGEGRASHDEHTFLVRLLALSLIHSAYGLQWEGIAQRAPCAIGASLVVVVGLFRIEEVWVGGVHPPSVGALVEEIPQILPVDVACLGRESIIDTHARRIVHAWRPEGQSALWPCLEVEEQSLLVELSVCLRLWSEACPDAYHEVGVLLVHVAYHPLAVGIFLREEVHGVP